MSRKTEIRTLLQSLLEKNGDSRPFSDVESLLGDGRLQSIDGIEIVVFLEERYGLDFSNIGFDRDVIDSVNAIEALVENNAGAG